MTFVLVLQLNIRKKRTIQNYDLPANKGSSLVMIDNPALVYMKTASMGLLQRAQDG